MRETLEPRRAASTRAHSSTASSTVMVTFFMSGSVHEFRATRTSCHPHRCRRTPAAAALAVASGRDIASRHPFIDGNKRIAFVVTELLLQLNGFELTASDDDLPEDAFADWLRRHVVQAG